MALLGELRGCGCCGEGVYPSMEPEFAEGCEDAFQTALRAQDAEPAEVDVKK